MTRAPFFHTAGVGAGPANLSLAALFEAAAPGELALFDAQPGPGWHDSLLFRDVRMQTAWVKDLVSLVDPTHRLSFLNYLVCERRVFSFLTAQYTEIPRLEYNKYLAWAAARLSGIRYGTPVERIDFDTSFALYSGGELVARAENLVIGTGSVPHVPPGLAGLGSDLMVVAEGLTRWLDGNPVADGDRVGSAGPVGGVGPVGSDDPVAVVGGGQTGAECVLELCRHGFTDVHWFGRRGWFAPLDDSPSANELYRPAYSAFLDRVPAGRKLAMVDEAVLTSDGITESTLRTLFQQNYESLLRTGRAPVTMLPGRWVTSGEPAGEGVLLGCEGAHGHERHRMRFVVVAAGHRPGPMPFDDRLAELIDADEHGEPVVDVDYSLRWKSEDSHKIFVQNRARHVHGLPDATLSLLPMRAAIIINSLFGRAVFEIADEFGATVWD